MQPDQQQGKELRREETEGQLNPSPTLHPPSWATQTWHGSSTALPPRHTGLGRGDALPASPQVSGEQALAVKQAVGSNNPGAKGHKAEFARSFRGKSCKAGLSLLRKQLLCCSALCSTVLAIRQAMASAEEPSQPQEEGEITQLQHPPRSRSLAPGGTAQV